MKLLAPHKTFLDYHRSSAASAAIPNLIWNDGKALVSEGLVLVVTRDHFHVFTKMRWKVCILADRLSMAASCDWVIIAESNI